MSVKGRLEGLLEQTGGVLPFLPTFIPRSFAKPGKRLRLHPDEYYPLGIERGAIKERWFVSSMLRHFAWHPEAPQTWTGGRDDVDTLGV